MKEVDDHQMIWSAHDRHSGFNHPIVQLFIVSCTTKKNHATFCVCAISKEIREWRAVWLAN